MDEYSKFWYECSKNLGKLNTETGENVAIRKILKIGILQCFKVAKRAATPLKKAIWRKQLIIGLARA